MSLAAGTRLGPYEVGAPIGKGGMGEVYRARDTKLDREVAIKVLPEEFARDEERLARFEREAKLLASLNHPNIASIYGLEESGGVKALVLELAEGPTLAERIADGPIPVEEALPIAKQIAEALEVGHEAGVIHRDLKPANIKLKEDGTVKVLDYGLAKALEGDAATGADSGLSQSPTLTRQGTQVGVVLGTAAYMSPEQARGKTVDKRTDIWAFGVVLFEMVTGKSAFRGEDVSLTLSNVLQGNMDWAALPANFPPDVDRFLRRCLERDPKQRVRDIGDMRLAIDGAFEADAQLTALASGARGIPWALVIPGLLGAAVLGAVVWSGVAPSGSRPASARVGRFELSLPTDTPLYVAITQPDVAISPDGSRIVARGGSGTAAGRLVVRALGELAPTSLVEGRPWGPFISPDGAWLGFEKQSGSLNKIPLAGGASTIICDLQGRLRGASWGDDDGIVFATAEQGSLWRVPAAGGTAEVLLKPEPDEDHIFQWPEVLPGSRAALFTIQTATDAGQVAVVDLETREYRVLFPGTFPRFVRTGHIVFSAGAGEIRAVGFDAERLAVTTEAGLVLGDVLTKPSGAADFAVANDGTLVYVPAQSGVRSSRSSVTPVLVARDGRQEAMAGLRGNLYQSLDVSPDGERVAFEIRNAEANFTGDIWVYDMKRGALDRLTTEPINEVSPVFTHDGGRLAYGANPQGQWGLFLTTSGDDVEVLAMTEDATSLTPQSWSSDGTLLLGQSFLGRSLAIGIWTGDQSIDTLFDQYLGRAHPSISPDGDWLAYGSYRSGRMEVYVDRFPELDERHLVSNRGGDWPMWSGDGRELFYVTDDSTMTAQIMAVPVSASETFESGVPEPLFQGRFRLGYSGRSYDVTPDGRFVMLALQGDQAEAELILVQNWFEELKRLVPTDN